MKNPCRTCEIFTAGNGYADAHCLHCNKRVAYVAALGPMVDSMPIELMDIAKPVDAGGDRGGEESEVIDMDATAPAQTVEPAPKNTKICPRNGCAADGRPQPVANFGSNKSKEDGLQIWCKACTRQYAAQRYQNSKAKKTETEPPGPPTPPAPGPTIKTMGWSFVNKVCPIKKCEHQGRPQPIENFGENKAQKDGLQTSCKDCNRKYDRKSRASAKTVKTQKKTDTQWQWIDGLFEGYPDLRMRLQDLAAAEMRSLRKQLLYMVQMYHKDMM